MILSVETQGDIRRLHDLWVARLAFEYRVEQTDIRNIIDLQRADAPAATGGPETQPVPSSPAGREAADAPASPEPSLEANAPDLAETVPDTLSSGRELSVSTPAATGIEPEDSTSGAGRTLDAPEPSGFCPADPPRSEAATREDAESAAPGTLPPHIQFAGLFVVPVPEQADPPPPAEETGHASSSATPPDQIPDAVAPPLAGPTSEAAAPAPDDAAEATPPASAAPTKKQMVKDTHEAHPDWTIDQIAAHLGLTRGSVSGHLSALNIRLERKQSYAPRTPDPNREAKVAQAVIKAPNGTLTDRVRFLHERFPSLTASLIAKELGANRLAVQAVLDDLRGKAAPPKQEERQFGSEQELHEHYAGVGKRLGKPS